MLCCTSNVKPSNELQLALLICVCLLAVLIVVCCRRR
uniref:4 kDa protein n=1 Tax=Grapevine leafroll-associated virus 3 TaxID=55951 RepID=A0A345T7Y9_9CLOS|nr:4 kDa protein [Grapevine leafroll-associated virus 3]QBZ78476.1 hypothetical protein [Grapevine leafroll-associated virus 3]UYT09231.1 hypothetical protein [Grapevine leafroll-associated virus 3]UYT09244.1 hypothetical protein [Grapevine leafroll-associated virus 3]